MRLRLATRLTAVFVLLALVAGVLGGVLFARQLLLGLDNGLDVGLRARAQTLTQELAPSGTLDTSKLATVTGTTGLTQVVSKTGRVVATSAGAGAASLFNARQLQNAGRGTYIVDSFVKVPAVAGSSDSDQSLRLLGAPLDGAGDLLIVGAAHDTVNSAVKRTVVELFLIGVIGIVLAGLAARALIRAALRPVERARAEAERASGSDGPAVLAVPPGDDEFSRLVTTFNGLLARRHELLEAERTFTADAGHELRTPLAILAAELELAARPGRSEQELREALLVAQDETDRLVRLTESLLLLARGDNQTLVHLRQDDLAAVVGESIAALDLMASLADVSVVYQGPVSLLVVIDRERMRLAVDNLVRNALRFAPPGSQVEVSLAVAGAGWRLSVRDHGSGFDPGFLPQAFDRFTRDTSSRTRIEDEGSGLGLAIVRTIVDGHGGQAFAANASDGQGAVVGFEVPRPALR